ncbi:MAG: hypothetical protein HQ552_04415 [Desulfobacteraceae bacterium]|nr:hypothetical protein [Desulfobacteraceae bacterium]
MTPDGDIIYSPNSAIDVAIKEMLPNFDSASQRRMRKAILNAKRAAENHRDENTDAGARHIFREFILAYTLNQNGFAFEYEKPIQGKTPDWLDDTALLMLESYTYERGGSSNFFDRVKSSVTSKCNKYNNIVVANDFRLVVAVYIDFLTCMTLEECRESSEGFRPVFHDNDSLWAVVFFTETQVINSKQQYEFFCLSADSSFEDIPNWPFATMSMER